MKFRHDINGLRAIAVIAVVLFHFNAAWSPGGFAGVDVFFVISGFLMTGIIFRGIEKNDFSVLKFYLARANRIIPALALLCLVLLTFGWYFLTPAEYKALNRHAVTSVGFVSNFLYFMESGYFDAASHKKWLLHTWSLSVEWQFYIIYPLILIALRKFMSIHALKVAVVIATVIGFVFSAWATYQYPSASYYLFPMRAWEMMAGGVAYLYPLTLTDTKKKATEWCGLALIVASYFLISAENPWPGYLAIFPVLGSFLIIQAQRDSSVITNNIVFQKLGSWSYSIYLWHWPLVVAIYYFTLPEIYTYLGLALSILLGYLSYTYIERNKFISSYSYMNYKKLFAGTLVVLGTSLAVASQHPYKLGFVPDSVLSSIKRSEYECFSKAYQHAADSDFCTISNGDKKIFAYGDSHSYSSLPAIESIAKERGYELTYTGYGGCPPLLGVYPDRKDQADKDCHALNDKVMDYISSSDIDTVILTARWTYYTAGNYDGGDYQYIRSSQEQPFDQPTSITAFKRGVQDTFAAYAKTNAHVIVLLQVPMQTANPDQIFYNSLIDEHLDIKKLETSSITLQQHKQFQQPTNDIIIAEAAKYPNITVIDPTMMMCNNINCPVGNEIMSYYFDDDHLSTSGSLKLRDLIDKSI